MARESGCRPGKPYETTSPPLLLTLLFLSHMSSSPSATPLLAVVLLRVSEESSADTSIRSRVLQPTSIPKLRKRKTVDPQSPPAPPPSHRLLPSRIETCPADIIHLLASFLCDYLDLIHMGRCSHMMWNAIDVDTVWANTSVVKAVIRRKHTVLEKGMHGHMRHFLPRFAQTLVIQGRGFPSGVSHFQYLLGFTHVRTLSLERIATLDNVSLLKSAFGAMKDLETLRILEVGHISNQLDPKKKQTFRYAAFIPSWVSELVLDVRYIARLRGTEWKSFVLLRRLELHNLHSQIRASWKAFHVRTIPHLHTLVLMHYKGESYMPPHHFWDPPPPPPDVDVPIFVSTNPETCIQHGALYTLFGPYPGSPPCMMSVERFAIGGLHTDVRDRGGKTRSMDFSIDHDLIPATSTSVRFDSAMAKNPFYYRYQTSLYPSIALIGRLFPNLSHIHLPVMCIQQPTGIHLRVPPCSASSFDGYRRLFAQHTGRSLPLDPAHSLFGTPHLPRLELTTFAATTIDQTQQYVAGNAHHGIYHVFRVKCENGCESQCQRFEKPFQFY